MLPLYQCLQNCGGILFAATSFRVDSFNIDDGSWLSSSTYSIIPEDYPYSSSQLGGSNGKNLDSPGIYHFPRYANGIPGIELPAKKRRLFDAQIIEEQRNGGERDPDSKQHDIAVDNRESLAVVTLKTTKHCGHVIVVTGEDKSIRVFEHDGKGHLNCISQRKMPKRPCAIALTSDDSTIICADKFGDVYSIPLLFSDPSVIQDEQDPNAIGSLATKLSKPFVPAANDLTVHSIRNRMALQNQLRQKQSVSEKPEPQFDRELLLGHVSMLTDIILAERYGKSYIITADRDEHIRISRGIPQTHVIEGYCLGHKEFVSRICIPSERPDLLVSGGGDDYIFLWNWPLRKLLHKVNLRNCTQKAGSEAHQTPRKIHELNRYSPSPSGVAKYTVSSIQYMRGTLNQQNDFILVACEGMPILFIFSLLADFTLLHHRNLELQGNPLDLTPDSISNRVFVSVDSIHHSGSTNQLRNELDPPIQPLQTFQMIESEWIKASVQFNVETAGEARVRQESRESSKGLSSLFYPIEKLRKTGSED